MGERAGTREGGKGPFFGQRMRQKPGGGEGRWKGFVFVEGRSNSRVREETEKDESSEWRETERKRPAFQPYPAMGKKREEGEREKEALEEA